MARPLKLSEKDATNLAKRMQYEITKPTIRLGESYESKRQKIEAIDKWTVSFARLAQELEVSPMSRKLKKLESLLRSEIAQLFDDEFELGSAERNRILTYVRRMRKPKTQKVPSQDDLVRIRVTKKARGKLSRYTKQHGLKSMAAALDKLLRHYT